MDSERWKRIDGLVQAALERPAEERAEFVRRQCAGDKSLEREVLSLLASGEDAGSFLESPAMEMAGRQDAGHSFSGQTVSHYRVLEMLGAGGMGMVYKAFDTRLKRHVALKFLPPHLRHNQELKQRLSEEARAASNLDHPNIVIVHDIDETAEGDLFIAMAYHGGVTLRHKIESAKPAGLPVPEALDIARQVASGLARAHERGILHRDIKPGNLIVAPDGVARIIDFGLAKTTEATATLDGSTKGTPLYMSPEQASGKALDQRTDLWSLGAVLYEMLACRPPFSGDSHLAIMRAIVHDAPPALRQLRPEVPASVERIVLRALEKDPARRYGSGAEMAADLSAALAALQRPAHRPGLSRGAWMPAAAVVLLLAVGAFWWYRRSENRHWAREQGLPQVARLTSERKALAAELLMSRVAQALPDDPQISQMAAGLTHIASIRSSPPGAMVEIKDYLSPGDPWTALGTTPLKDVRLPNGYLRWRVTRPGSEQYLGAPLMEDVSGWLREFDFPLEPAGAVPAGMVPVPAIKTGVMVWSVGFLGPYDFPKFYIDRFEVTNREYQNFVDAGGYTKRDYWKEKIQREGRELTWEQAMDLFRDSTGRPGPATWTAGHYPSGQEDLPVGGVSYYEAAAYAEYAGKSLPVIAQWLLGAPSSIAKYVTQRSNFGPGSQAPVGKFDGLGPFGTYDMAGNMAEWVSTAGGADIRYNLGGAWNTSSADYWEPVTIPSLSRSPNNGLRCVKNTAPLPAEVLAELHLSFRDLSKTKPVTDDVYRVYKNMYAYDPAPLNTREEPVAQDSPDWHKYKVTFDAAYGKERMTAYLFVPMKVRPPYQTVVFFPSARALANPSSETLGDMQFIDYVIQSGRAVMYPVYKGTYERPGGDNTPSTTAGRELLIQESKDLGRSIDYLATRTDIDRNRIGYMGVSMGAALGVIFTAVEERLKAAIFLDGGFYAEKLLPGADQADFAPRLKVPVLLISGKFDWIFLNKDGLVRMLGTPQADKKMVLFDTAHNVSEQRTDMMREVLAFLDRYFGKVG